MFGTQSKIQPPLPAVPTLHVFVLLLFLGQVCDVTGMREHLVSRLTRPQSREPCCFGPTWYKDGEVVDSLPKLCLQLVCNNGDITYRYFNNPGDTGCCIFDGEMYPDGAHLPSHCVDLVCRKGEWVCAGAFKDCCGQCTVYDDPHIVTFDQQYYDYHGTCNYSLAQSDSSYNPPVGVFAQFIPCNTASCLRYTVFKVNPNTVIHIDAFDIFNLKVNGESVSVGGVGVQQLETPSGVTHPVLVFITGNCIVLVGSSRIMVRHCRYRVDIFAHPTNMDHLDGICGHYNSYVKDDFTDRDGKTHDLANLPLAFPLSWKTKEQTEDHCKKDCPEKFGCDGEIAPDPCQARDKGSEEWYRYLLLCEKKLAEVLQESKELWHHVESCAFDLCLLKESGAGQKAEEEWLEAVCELTCEAYKILLAKQGKVTDWICGENSTTSTISTTTTSTSSSTTSTSTSSSTTSTSTSSSTTSTSTSSSRTTSTISSSTTTTEKPWYYALCSVFNDPHFMTFDNYQYDFHGTCNYSLTQSNFSYNPEFGVFADFKQCSRVSCISHTVFKDNPHTVIHIDVSNVFKLVVNGDVVEVTSTTPTQIVTSGVSHPVLAYITGNCVTLQGEKSRLTVRHCRHRVDIFARKSLLEKQLYGLCGHYNSEVKDDFTDRDGKVHDLTYRPLAFPVSWKTKEQKENRCDEHCPEEFGCEGETTPDPCKASKEGSEWNKYLEICKQKLVNELGEKWITEEQIVPCAFDLCMLLQNGGGKDEMNRLLIEICDLNCEAILIQKALKDRNITKESDWKCKPLALPGDN